MHSSPRKDMSTDDAQLRADIALALDRLRSLRDEARVRVHLASMDARDAWDRLQPKLIEAEHAAAHASQTALDTIDATARKLSDLIIAL